MINAQEHALSFKTLFNFLKDMFPITPDDLHLIVKDNNIDI